MKKINLLLLLLCCLVGQTTIAQDTKKTRLSAWSLELGMEIGTRWSPEYEHSSYSIWDDNPVQSGQYGFFLPLGANGSLEYSFSDHLALSVDVNYHHLPTLIDTYKETSWLSYHLDDYIKRSDQLNLFSSYSKIGLGLKYYIRKAPIGPYFKLIGQYYQVSSQVSRSAYIKSNYSYEGYDFAPVKMSNSGYGLSIEWGKRTIISERFYVDWGIRYSKLLFSSMDNRTFDAQWYTKVFVDGEIVNYYPISNINNHQFQAINVEDFQLFVKLGIFKFNI